MALRFSLASACVISITCRAGSSTIAVRLVLGCWEEHESAESHESCEKSAALCCLPVLLELEVESLSSVVEGACDDSNRR